MRTPCGTAIRGVVAGDGGDDGAEVVRGLIGGLASGLIAGHAGCRGIVREREVYLDLYISSDRFSVQQVRPVLPLLDRCDGCRGEHGMSSNQLDVFDVAGIAHDHLQAHHALNARLSGERRVNGINLRYQQVGCDFGGDVYRLRRSLRSLLCGRERNAGCQRK